MAVVVDALINGKITETIMTNVVTNNEKMKLNKKTAGFVKTTTNNIDNIAAVKGRPRNVFRNPSAKTASSVTRSASNNAISGLNEISKGIYLKTVT